MEFLHPWAIWVGAAAATLPVVVHLWTRPRPAKFALSTIRFVQEVLRQRRARRRLRDLIVLALRTAAVLLFALAVARPVPPGGDSEMLDTGRETSAKRIVVLDVSQSMAATEAGVSSAERARAAAVRWLKYRPGLKVNVLFAAADCRPAFDQVSANFEAMRDAVADATVLPERLDVRRSLESASQMLASASQDDARQLELVIISDFQRTNWASADFSLVPTGTKIRLESVAPSDPPANVAILQVQSHFASNSGEGRIVIEVANFTGNTRLVRLEAELGDRIYRLEGPCPAAGSTVLEHEIRTDQTGWTVGEVRLVGWDDALAADDSRPIVCYRRRPLRFALITRESPEIRPSSSHFLRCALAPREDPKDESSRQVHVVGSTADDLRRLASADVVVINRPGTLSDDSLRLVAELLRRGRPVLYVASEPSDALYLRKLAEIGGSDWQLPVDFTPSGTQRAQRPLRIGHVDRRAAPFEAFGEHLPALIGPLRFFTGIGSRRVERGVSEDVLAEYDDSTASLVLTRFGAGSLAVLNVDLATSTLPKSAAFAPLMQELVAAMIRDRQRQRSFCGEPLVVRLPGDWTAADLTLVGPEGSVAPGSSERQAKFGWLNEEPAGVVWHWPSPASPGVYRVQRAEGDVFAQAIEIAPEESDLTSLDANVLTQRLAAGRSVRFANLVGSTQASDDWWAWLLVACVVCMMGETVALLAFRDS